MAMIGQFRLNVAGAIPLPEEVLDDLITATTALPFIIL
jgi:hypothetical protein